MDEAITELRRLLIDGELDRLRALRDVLARKLEDSRPLKPDRIHPLAVQVIPD